MFVNCKWKIFLNDVLNEWDFAYVQKTGLLMHAWTDWCYCNVQDIYQGTKVTSIGVLWLFLREVTENTRRKATFRKLPVVWFDDSYPFEQMLIIDLKSFLLVILNSYIEIFVFVYKNACIFFFKMTQFVQYFNVIFNKMIIENQQIHWLGLKS